jgi:cell division protein FtsQ
MRKQKTFYNPLEARKYRLQRRSGNLARDAIYAFLLLGAVFTITAFAVYIYLFVVSAPWLMIRETSVRGVHELTEKDVLALAAVKPRQNLFAVNCNAVARRIRTNPWVRDVFVGRELPGRLVLIVRERRPVAMVKQGPDLFLMDTEGVPFKRWDTGDEADFPVLTGGGADGRMPAELTAKAVALLDELARTRDLAPYGAVSEIHGSTVTGFTVYTDAGLCFRLGFDNYGNKFKRLAPVMADLEKRQIKPAYLLIDLADPTKITVQPRRLPGPPAPAEPAQAYRT